MKHKQEVFKRNADRIKKEETKKKKNELKTPRHQRSNKFKQFFKGMGDSLKSLLHPSSRANARAGAPANDEPSVENIVSRNKLSIERTIKKHNTVETTLLCSSKDLDNVLPRSSMDSDDSDYSDKDEGPKVLISMKESGKQ